MNISKKRLDLLIPKVKQYLRKNRCSLSDEDIDLFEQVVVELEQVGDRGKPSENMAGWLAICKLCVELFTDTNFN